MTTKVTSGLISADAALVDLNIDANTLYVDASENSVGIGVTTIVRPPLQVHRASNSDVQIHMTNNATGATASDGMTVFANSSSSGFWYRESGSMVFATNNSERLRIDASGNIGVGTTSPAGNLHISTTGEAKVIIEGDSGNSGSEDSAILEFKTDAGAVRHRVEATGSSGNDLKLVAGSTGATQSTGKLIFETKPSGGNATERARIDSGGNFLVGQTSVNYNAVGSSIANNGILRVCRDDDLVGAFNRKTSFGPLINLYKDGSSIGTIGAYTTERLYIGSGDTGLVFAPVYDSIYPIDVANRGSRDDAIDIGYINVKFDDVYATNGTIQTSDQNEKNTITDSDLGLDFVKRLSPKSYKFNGKTRTHYGLIAQDVETVLSDINKSTTDFAGFIKGDVSEEQDGSNYRYALRYNEFIAPLVKAIQEQQTIIEDLKTRIETLEG